MPPYPVWQVHQLILMVGDSAVPHSGKELWYDSRYVTRQLAVPCTTPKRYVYWLSSMRCDFLNVMMCFMAGEWSDMHMRKSRKGYIAAMEPSNAACACAVKLELFPDSFNEGVEQGQGEDLLVLFEPSPCLRGSPCLGCVNLKPGPRA
jgi:hypothetical protein